MPLLVDVRQLGVINELIQDGAANVADSFGTLAGVETTIDIKSLAFVDPDDLPDEIGAAEVYAATIDLTEPPYGSFMLTFSEDTAAAVAELVAGRPVEGDLTSMQESALQEMCNICTSGFIDGFADTLETTIDMGTPALEHTDGKAVVRTQLSHIREESIAVVLDSRVCVPERNRELELHVYLVPAPGAFVNLLDNIDLDRFETDAAGEVPG
jgi:chemotaxis protein CheC